MATATNQVAVTHFINPHLFWYHKIASSDELHVLAGIEQKLQSLYRNKHADVNFQPTVGQVVAVHYVALNKYIRAEVLQKAEFQKEEFKVWSIDYGFPLLTQKEYVRKLPKELYTPRGQIRCGGLYNIQPAEIEYNVFESDLAMMKQDQWLQKACDMLEKLLADAFSITFEEKFQSDEQYWGDLLIVTHKGNKINARTYLQDIKCAVDVPNEMFQKLSGKLKTTKIAPYLSNSRKPKMRFNSIKDNMAEHSLKMNSLMIDNFAKRKVENWIALQTVGNADVENNYFPESGAESVCDQMIDDIHFDDSVSAVIHQNRLGEVKAAKSSHRAVYANECKEQKNFIGKAGAMTKARQQKYASKHNLPPQADSNAFNMDPAQFDVFGKADLSSKKAETTISSASGSTKISKRMQKLIEARAEHARNAQKQQPLNVDNFDCNSTTVSSGGGANSIISSHMYKLKEARKKHALEAASSVLSAKEIDSVSSVPRPVSSHVQRLIEMRKKHIQNESTMLTDSHSVTYQVLDNETTFDKTHDNASELSAKGTRTKRLIELRRKLQPPQETHADETITITPQSQMAITSTMLQGNMKKIREENTPADTHSTYDFKIQTKETSKLPKMSMATKKESEEAYQNCTFVPGGFDLAYLKTYNNEKDHWHRKKSTRYERVPHDKSVISSSEELLLNSSLDQSSSSSDFFQVKQDVKPKPKSSSTLSKRLLKQNDTFNVPSIEYETKHILDNSNPSASGSKIINPFKCSQQRETGFNDGLYQSEISTSTAIKATLESKTTNYKPRQLKSSTAQRSKIDDILKLNSLETENGNKRSLDLQNFITSPHKSHDKLSNLTSSSNEFSANEEHNHTTSNTKALIENHSIGNIDSNIICKSPSSAKDLKDFSNKTLLEIKLSDSLPIIKNEIALQTKFIDHLVLAHSRVPLMPIENVSEASFLPEIHEEMRSMRANKVYRIQVHSWSHIMRGNSLFVVNPTRTGKTWSYLPALCNLVCCRMNKLNVRENMETLLRSYGPVAIVLVASSKHVETTYGYCRRLMSGFNKTDAPNCIPSYGMRNFIETKTTLLSGCGILITTPASLLRLLKDGETEPLFNSERLLHIVIDDLDLMLSRSKQDFELAARTLFKMSKKSKYKTLQPQLIVTSRDWDGLLIKFMRHSNQPLLLIGDFLEAAVYGRATLSVKLKSSQEKNDTIFRFVKDKIQMLHADLDSNRILIMCNDDDDVEVVFQYIRECGFPCLAYHNGCTSDERNAVFEWKKKMSSQVLICSDTHFHELQIQNVHNLIHYSMPTSWTQFTTRFSALAQIYDNFVATNFDETATNNASPPHSMILLDEDNSLQLPRLVDFMRKHNQDVHPDILAVSQRVLVAREESRIRKGALLCPQVMEFGECDEARCDKRHVLTRFDMIREHDDIPCVGEIRIRVLKVFSPTYYAVRLLQHKPPNSTKWHEIRRSNEVLMFSLKLDQYYRNNDNLVRHWPPCYNDICIYKYSDMYKRARILDAPKLEAKKINIVSENLKVTLKLIDDGPIISSVKCNELIVCADEFKEFPEQAIDMRLMRVVPFDNERDWNSKTTKHVQQWIVDDIKNDHIVQVSISFSLANTVWIKELVVMEQLSTLGTYRQYVNLKRSLIYKKFATIYEGDRKHLREIAEENGLLKTTFQNDADNDNGSALADTSTEYYESCQNDSVDLIKFSSSNENDVSANSSMKSAKYDLLANVGNKKLNKELNTVEEKERSESKEKSQTTSKSGSAEEDWDALLQERRTEEIYLPLKTDVSNKENFQSSSLHTFPSTSRPKQESWSQLALNEVTKVEIGDEEENGNWENIFLQIIDKKHMAIFDDLTDLINKHVTELKATTRNETDPKRVYEFEPLHNCIVKYNNIYLRAKVHGVFGANVQERLYRFFLCDYACFTNVKYRDLYKDCFYETTDAIINCTPYQAVHCTLAGVQWDRFTKRYKVTKDYLYACPVEERTADEKKSLNLRNLPISSYKILLYECDKENDYDQAVMLNRTLVDNGITTTDESTKDFLDFELKMPEIRNEIEESENEVYTFEKLLECIQNPNNLDDLDNNFLTETSADMVKSNEENEKINKNKTLAEIKANNSKELKKVDATQQNLLTVSKKKPSTSNKLDDDDDIERCSTDSDNIKSSTSLTSSSNDMSIANVPLPPLKAFYKRPMTTWYESDCVIFISIHAPDITDYILEVTQKTVLFAGCIHGEQYVLLLNLLGSINAEYVSHEIKGLNVVVRLVKNVFEKWPRLLNESTKYAWLKYNYNAFDLSELEYVMPQQRLQSILESAPNFNEANLRDDLDSEDSETDKCQTYNHIANNDDNYDPFSEVNM